MKRLLFLFAAVLFASISFSQGDDDDYPYVEDHKASFGYSMSYDKYNFDFTSTDFEASYNFSLGFHYKRTIKTNLELRLGLVASERGYNHFQTFEFFPTVEYRVWAAYLDLSAAVGYRYMLNKSIVFVPSGGFIYGSPVYKSVDSEDVDPDDFVIEYLTQDFQSTLGLSVQLAAEFHLGRRFFIQVEPYYRKWFSPFNSLAMESGPSSIGIGSGLFVKF